MNKEKVVFGITTHQRNEWLDETINAIRKNTTHRFEIVVACDSAQSVDHCKKKKYIHVGGEPKGIAYNKNRCITWAQSVGYDYLFLMDDDVFPTKVEWDKWIIDGIKLFNLGHWVFMADKHHGEIIQRIAKENYELSVHQNDGGSLMVFPKSTIDKIGGFNPAFYQNRYGGEHSDFARRIARAGLSPHQKISFVDCDKWIDGHDLRVFMGREAMGPPLSPQDRAELDRQINNGLRIYNEQAGCQVYQDYKVDI